MNKWNGFSILLLLLASAPNFFPYTDACNTVSSIQCVNSNSYLWCVDSGDGTLVTIGDTQSCPGVLVCDETQVNGCVSADSVVTTTETPSETTTSAPTTLADTETTTISAETTTETSTETTTEGNTETTTETVTESTDSTDSTSTDEVEDSSILSDADFSCTYEGLYKAQDCSRFHVCYKFIWFIRHYYARCSKGLYWSSTEKICVLQSLSDCP